MSKPTVEQYILQSTCDYLLVKCDSRYENELEITGESGQKIQLQVDGELEEKKHRVWGTVLDIPRKFSDRIIFSEDGKPVRMNMIQAEAEVGEKVFFDYTALADEFELEPGVYAIPYDNIICVVRDGQLTTVGSHVLLAPVYPDGVVDTGKGIMGLTNSFGMVVELNIQPLKNQGLVVATGLPLKDRKQEVAPGMKVILDKWSFANRYTIEKEEYIVCREKDILMILKS